MIAKRGSVKGFNTHSNGGSELFIKINRIV